MNKSTPKFNGKIVNGKFIPYNLVNYNTYIRKYEEKEVSVTITKKFNKRSNPLNRYYWGVVLDMIAEATGYTKEELHECFKYKFLRVVLDNLNGMETVRSTTDLTNPEFQDYIAKIIRLAAEFLGLSIPEPNEVALPEYEYY